MVITVRADYQSKVIELTDLVIKQLNIMNNLENVQEFKVPSLWVSEGFNTAKTALKGLTGIYCMKCIISGAVYVGSSVDLSQRLLSHVFNYSSNPHLQNAIKRHGLNN